MEVPTRLDTPPPLRWYWSKIGKYNESSPETRKGASWVELMLDFELATRKMLLGTGVAQKKNHVRDVGGKGDTTVSQRAYNFAAASRRILKLCCGEDLPANFSVLTLSAYGGRQIAGLPERPALLDPQAVFKELAVQAITYHEAFKVGAPTPAHWKWPPRYISMPPLKWVLPENQNRGARRVGTSRRAAEALGVPCPSTNRSAKKCTPEPMGNDLCDVWMTLPNQGNVQKVVRQRLDPGISNDPGDIPEAKKGRAAWPSGDQDACLLDQIDDEWLPDSGASSSGAVRPTLGAPKRKEEEIGDLSPNDKKEVVRKRLRGKQPPSLAPCQPGRGAEPSRKRTLVAAPELPSASRRKKNQQKKRRPCGDSLQASHQQISEVGSQPVPKKKRVDFNALIINEDLNASASQ